ncbi:glycosyltransferase [Pseudaestuariivita sp.]|uniref:glycosyltransferase n=1 Tax=Pseudaestuariivita sp. TaxID=2211669 RepID=UPI004057DA79
MILTLQHMAYFAVIAILAMVVPKTFLGDFSGAENTIFILGALGMWRYSWAATNFMRAYWFRHVVYPLSKARSIRRFEKNGTVSHCYMLVTSFMVPPEVTMTVYRAAFNAAANARDGATIVASVVDGADQRLIQQIYDTMPRDMSSVKLIIDRIPANGKRDALAQTLNIIRGLCPTERDILVFVDGDTEVPENIWYASAPVFTNDKVGALTTDEASQIPKQSLFHDWFVLRFIQRQMMMCSMGLSRRVLTLTGRMSVFRATLATDPTFIEGVDADYLDHWRLGRVKFLTGDDKSTWYWLLTRGYELRYLPDVQSVSHEDQPRPTFLDSAQTLMVRWFGNMMRTNGRALKHSPFKIGFFTWWSILDQRVSAWTTLVGPITVVITAVSGTWQIVPLYIAWVMTTRYIFCVILFSFTGKVFKITHPFLLYFGQIAGASVKTFVLFRLDKQKWTRQGATLDPAALKLAAEEKIKAWDSTAHHAIAIAALTAAVALIGNF